MYWQYNSTGKHVMVGTLLLIVSISVLLGLLLHKKEDKYKKIPLIIITVLMLGFELAKQIINIKNGYDYNVIPLHFCSLFLYFFPLAVFTKGKLKDFGLVMSLVCTAWMTILLYINPEPIIGKSPENVFATFSNVHTFVHHHLAVAFLFVSLALNVYNINKWSYLYVVLGISLYAVVAIPAAHATGVSFCNLLDSNIDFMENFRQNFGQVIYTIAMWLIGVGGGFVIIGTHHAASTIVRKKVIGGSSTEHIKK